MNTDPVSKAPDQRPRRCCVVVAWLVSADGADRDDLELVPGGLPAQLDEARCEASPPRRELRARRSNRCAPSLDRARPGVPKRA